MQVSSLFRRTRDMLSMRVRKHCARTYLSPHLSVTLLEDRVVPAINISFDYTHDTAGFFSDQTRKDALERAAAQLESIVVSQLGAISPGGSNTWTAKFSDPSPDSFDGSGNPNIISVSNMTVAANELKIFVGTQPSMTGILAYAVRGFQDSISGSPSFVSSVNVRGVPSHAPWGGSISFDSSDPWYFGTGTVIYDHYDFESVAVHELAHILGFGSIITWTAHALSGTYTAQNTTFRTWDAGVPVSSEGSHWAVGTVWDEVTSVMASNFLPGQRRSFTGLDVSSLEDLGWKVNRVIGTSGNDEISLTSAGGSLVAVSIQRYNTDGTKYSGKLGGPLEYTIDAAGGIYIDGAAGDDVIRIVGPMTAGQIVVSGGTGNDTVHMIGTSSADSYTVNGSVITRTGDQSVSLASDTESLAIYSGAGNDYVTINTGLQKPVGFNGGDGTDVLHMEGSSGADSYIVNGYSTIRTGGSDQTAYIGTDTESVAIYGRAGADELYVNDDRPRAVGFYGGDGSDFVQMSGSSSNVNIFFADDNAISRHNQAPVYSSSDTELVRVNGGAQNDTLSVYDGMILPLRFSGSTGTADAVYFYGTSGNDTFTSNAGGTAIKRNGDAYVDLGSLGDLGTESVTIFGGDGNDQATIVPSLYFSVGFDAGNAGFTDLLYITNPPGVTGTRTGTTTGSVTYPGTSYKPIYFTNIDN